MKRHRKSSLVSAVLFMALACEPTATTADARQGRPDDVADSFPVEGICAFPVLVELRGKAKAIALPGGGTLLTSPGLTATLTNLDDPTKQETLGIAGAVRETA